MKFNRKNRFIVLLLRIGLVSLRPDMTIALPYYLPPKWMFRQPSYLLTHMRFCGWLYFFRNKSANPRVEGRLLPWRWGFGVLGFEFGDRGSSVRNLNEYLR